MDLVVCPQAWQGSWSSTNHFFPQTSFAVGVLTSVLKLYGTDTHSKSCCGPVAPAVAPVAPGVAPWLYGSDTRSKSCCGPVAPAVAPVTPGMAPWLYGSDTHSKSCCGPVAPAVAPWPPAVPPAVRYGPMALRERYALKKLQWPRGQSCDPMASA